MENDTYAVKNLRYKNEMFVKRDDIVDLLRAFAAREETDVRNRIEELCWNLMRD